jgi:hypothetical protein
VLDFMWVSRVDLGLHSRVCWPFLACSVISCGVSSKYSTIKPKSGMNRTLKVINLSKSGSGRALSSLI